MSNIIDIDKIKNDIDKAEKKDNIYKSKQQLINELKPHIQILKDKGYSYTDIVKFLNERGLQINEGTLKSYLNRNVDKNTKIKNKVKSIVSNKKTKMVQQDIIDEANKNNKIDNSKFPLSDDEV